LKDLENTKTYNLAKIDEKIKNKIIEKIASIKEISSSNINENSKLIVDLFFDSLDLAEIKSFVQANFPASSNPPI
jgi:acyl carrier protein